MHAHVALLAGTSSSRRPVVEQVPAELHGFESVEWYYGNVYDDQGNPLNWWAKQTS